VTVSDLPELDYASPPIVAEDAPRWRRGPLLMQAGASYPAKIRRKVLPSSQTLKGLLITAAAPSSVAR